MCDERVSSVIDRCVRMGGRVRQLEYTEGRKVDVPVVGSQRKGL